MKKFIIKQLYKRLLNKIYNPFVDTNIKPLTFELKKQDKCLVISPHPDDESIGCGGIIKLYPSQFDVLCLTHGAKEDVRYSELHQAMEYAGINSLKMLNLKDKDVISGGKEFNKIDILNYDYIFAPYIFDQHKDHKAVSLLLNEKLKAGGYKQKLHIVFYEVWSAIAMPNYCVDITSVINDKKTMINFHKSQTASKNYAEKIAALNSYRGLLRNIEAAECFSVMSAADFQKLAGFITGV